MARINDLRVWAVYDTVVGRCECLSERQSDCRRIIDLFEKNHRHGVVLLRFDLCPLYYDSVSSVSSPAREKGGGFFTPRNKK